MVGDVFLLGWLLPGLLRGFSVDVTNSISDAGTVLVSDLELGPPIPEAAEEVVVVVED